MDTQKKKRRRMRLYLEADGKCFWCGCDTVMPEGWYGHPETPPKNLATVDHLFERGKPGRVVTAMGEQRLVLACWSCNQERGVVHNTTMQASLHA